MGDEKGQRSLADRRRNPRSFAKNTRKSKRNFNCLLNRTETHPIMAFVLGIPGVLLVDARGVRE